MRGEPVSNYVVERVMRSLLLAHVFVFRLHWQRLHDAPTEAGTPCFTRGKRRYRP